MARKGRPAKVTKEQLVEVAAELGFDDFSLAEVARRLGVTLQTLYNHVRDRDELLRLVADATEARHVFIANAGEDWIDWWRRSAQSMKQLYVNTPGLASLVMTRPLRTAPPRLQAWEVGQAVAERSGFTPVAGMWANMMVHEYICAWCARHERLIKDPPAAEPAECGDGIAAPHLDHAAQAALGLDLDLRFQMGLEALLSGLFGLRNREVDGPAGLLIASTPSITDGA